ncbi:MAG: hypothetical protein N2512_08170, partial [Armatimonadetes bacterium]|nr:hypothetical protein [Armatimonadota bacterium]
GWEPGGGILWRYATTEGGTCNCGTGNSTPNDDQQRHNAGSNIAFVDGHVKWMKWNQIKTVDYGGSVRYRASHW